MGTQIIKIYVRLISVSTGVSLVPSYVLILKVDFISVDGVEDDRQFDRFSEKTAWTFT